MKMFIAFNGLIAFAYSSRLRGIVPTANLSTDAIAQVPGTIVAPASVPAIVTPALSTGTILQVPAVAVPTATATAPILQVPTAMATAPTYAYGYGYPYIPHQSQPSLSYLQSLLVQNGIQSLVNKSVTTNNQNVVANTIASQGSNANTNMNNMAGSFTINGITVKPGDMPSFPKLSSIPTVTPALASAPATATATVIPVNASTAAIVQQPVTPPSGASSTAIIQQPTGTLVIKS